MNVTKRGDIMACWAQKLVHIDEARGGRVPGLSNSCNVTVSHDAIKANRQSSSW